MIPKELLAKKVAISKHGVQCVHKKSDETEQVEDENSGRLRKLSTPNEQYESDVFKKQEKQSSKDLTQDLRDAAWHSVDSIQFQFNSVYLCSAKLQRLSSQGT